MISAASLKAMAGACGLAESSIVVRSLDDGATCAIEEWRQLYPASMIKLPIALALAADIEAGNRRLEDVAKVSAANLTTNDAPSPFEAGCEARLEDLARAMLAASDNVATNVLIDVLGRERVNATCRAYGLQATAVRRKLSGSTPLIDDPEALGRNAHPAADAAILLTVVSQGRPRASQWLYAALEAQIWNGKLSAGLDHGDRFAHKTGDTDEVSHDGGIVTLRGGRRYVIVVYTALVSGPATDACFAAFARLLRPHLER